MNDTPHIKGCDIGIGNIKQLNNTPSAVSAIDNNTLGIQQYINKLDNELIRLKQQNEELIDVLNKISKWLDKLAVNADRLVKQNEGRFDSLADACRLDASNYRAVVKDIQQALNQHTKAEGD